MIYLKYYFFSGFAPTHQPSNIITSGFSFKSYHFFLLNLSSIALLKVGSLSLLNFFRKSKSKKFKRLKLPTFNKAIDDRFEKKRWYDLKEKPDVIIFEGWCVGAKSEKNDTLKRSINIMEKTKDKKQIWRKYVNDQLKSKYKKLYSQLNCLIYLKAKDFSLLQKWRLKQERKLWIKSKKNSKTKIMSKEDVLSFMQTYQRITQNMFRYMPKYASIIINLNSNHQIKSAVYKK